jgi:hypothetical protein
MIVGDETTTTTTTTMTEARATLADGMMIMYTMILDTAAVAMILSPETAVLLATLLETVLDLETSRAGEAAIPLNLT